MISMYMVFFSDMGNKAWEWRASEGYVSKLEDAFPADEISLV